VVTLPHSSTAYLGRQIAILRRVRLDTDHAFFRPGPQGNNQRVQQRTSAPTDSQDQEQPERPISAVIECVIIGSYNGGLLKVIADPEPSLMLTSTVVLGNLVSYEPSLMSIPTLAGMFSCKASFGQHRRRL
jgi:hypothetical protein